MEKTLDPAEIEEKWYRHWEESGAFRCGRRPEAEPYCIVIPPPNVTGSLHVGHALNNTLQDILARFERLRGRDVLWQPGTDHAGIATQMVVERQLAAEGTDRHEIGREAFIERVWKWREESGGQITNQLRRLGASCDWSRERFTMDDGLSKAVLKVFVDYYRKGLIYKDKRLVNWDPKLRTAISDLEVEQKETDGHFWHIRYPIEDADGQYIIVATTRPETMLGDTAVAVHPDDGRYTDLVGRHVILPLANRRIPIIADEWPDPEQGSGAVKITPAHDFNDFEVGRRHDLEMINIFDADACISDEAPEKYRGMDRYEARKSVVADLEELGLLDKVEAHRHMLPFGDRSGVVIEPWLTDQWYVDAKTLAKPAIEAVETGRTRFIPKTWEKTYYEWMRNIQPWCISRQLWWGHQIPAWYGPEGDVYVAETEAEAYSEARKKRGGDVELIRDNDVLDTWFSSALWPFSTLGWPEETPELRRYYPTATLVTAFDIIFFWVARMMMSGLHFMKEVPFHNVYITSLVRDAKGEKMSKSKGNVIDPLEFIEKYGADALRFTLAAMETQGRDIKLAEGRVEGYRNFATKLWNAARFCSMNGIGGSNSKTPPPAEHSLNRWIIGETARATEAVTSALEAFRFNDAAGAVYHFAWHTFCDWYLEFSKPVLQDGGDDKAAAETRSVAGWVLDQILVLLHPMMPFVTEEIWHEIYGGDRRDLILSEWPEVNVDVVDNRASEEFNWLIKVISEIRTARSEVNVPAGARVPAKIAGINSEKLDWIDRNRALISRLARLDSFAFATQLPERGSIQVVIDDATVALAVEDVVDIDEERSRLQKSIDKKTKEIKALEGRLNNPNFIDRAPDEVVADARERLEEEQGTKSKLEGALARLG